MINIRGFSFNPFQVNCYVLWDETGECVVVDASCADELEQEELAGFILKKGLNPVASVFTHCHTDHVAGADFIWRRFGLNPVIHREGLPILAVATEAGRMYGLHYPEPPEPASFLEEGDVLRFGDSELEVLYTPGHVDGSICLLNRKQGLLITGDVLFRGSIGRTDLPTGDYDLLIQNIQNKLMVLPDNTRVFPGHGPETSIGFERLYNPFL